MGGVPSKRVRELNVSDDEDALMSLKKVKRRKHTGLDGIALEFLKSSKKDN